jgi:hypothetical protein
LLVWFDFNAWQQYAQLAGLAQVQDCCFAGDTGFDESEKEIVNWVVMRVASVTRCLSESRVLMLLSC